MPSPCACCNAFERDFLNSAASRSDKAVWQFSFPTPIGCGRCEQRWSSIVERNGWRVGAFAGSLGALSYLIRGRLRRSGLRAVALAIGMELLLRTLWPRRKTTYISLPEESVALIERSVEAASVAEKGSKYRAHGTFIHHLSGLEMSETMKMSLLAWMPYILDGWMKAKPGFARKLLSNGQSSVTSDPIPIDTHQGNPDVDVKMPGTMLEGNEYGDEERVQANVLSIPQPRMLAHQIGPDIQPSEVMESSEGNIKAGLAKRVQPLPFMASRQMQTKIRKTVDAVLSCVFTKEKILKWRQDNPDFSEMASKKWAQDRFHHAWDEALSEVGCEVEHEFMIKVNEVLPSKGKAPRPIINCGDKGQIMMLMPVKCFEDLMFDYFEDASIKHLPKVDAMRRVSSRLSQPKANLVEGDGSAWDSCCTPEIREMTENRVMDHIVRILAYDSQIPQDWMDAMLKDMKAQKIRGKAKMVDFITGKAKVAIEAIRQSGHRGTSAFNYFINLICWLCVLCENPEKMIPKQDDLLKEWYKSAEDGEWYKLRYAFEGDDSAISTTEKLNAVNIEGLWTSLGFRMKLVYVSDKLTFTGYDFHCDENGPTGCFIPEIPRNISSSSWSSSSLLKMNPSKAHEVGMAAMLARAENFQDYGPLCAYFASLGIAHSLKAGDRALGETEAMHLGIHSCDSILDKLYMYRDISQYPDKRMRDFVERVVSGSVSHEETLSCLGAHFDDPCDTQSALRQLPRAMWGISGLQKARR